MWMPRCWQTSARVRQPITLALIVSTLWLSHQSTLGRPVTPAALSTCVGLTCKQKLGKVCTELSQSSVNWTVISPSQAQQSRPSDPPDGSWRTQTWRPAASEDHPQDRQSSQSRYILSLHAIRRGSQTRESLQDEPGRRKRLGWAFLVYQAFRGWMMIHTHR
jgi:hypothetical protein